MQPDTNFNLMRLLGMIGPLLIFWYFLLIRPQQKKQKEHNQLIANLKKNDEIVTVGGLCGTIVNVKDKTFTLRVDENTRIEITKNSVAYVVKKKEGN